MSAHGRAKMARELPTPVVHIDCDDAENPIIYRESYGIRAIERCLGQVKQEPTALQRLDQLIAAARREVATLCDLSDLEVISAAVDPAAASAALCAWVEAVINKTPGLLSKPALAATFLARMHNLQLPPPQYRVWIAPRPMCGGGSSREASLPTLGITGTWRSRGRMPARLLLIAVLAG